MMTIILIIQLITLAAIGAYIVYRLRWSVDLDRVAGAIAANILERYEGDVWVLDSYGTQTMARTKYLELCGISGLPERAADWIGRRVWSYIERAQAVTESDQPDMVVLYE